MQTYLEKQGIESRNAQSVNNDYIKSDEYSAAFFQPDPSNKFFRQNLSPLSDSQQFCVKQYILEY